MIPLKKILHPFDTIGEKLRESEIRQRFFTEKYDLEKTVQNSKEKGVSSNLICDKQVVVSLTTHGSRLYDVHLAIESIMQGTIRPNKIILWISEKDKSVALPVYLQNQQMRGLEIKYCTDIRSYTKLIPALQTYPDSIIVTIDDDIIYPFDTLEHLTQAHNLFPDCICSNFVREYPNSFSGNELLNNWPANNQKPFTSSYGFFEGFGGVLYPPRALNNEVFNEKVFMNSCETSDDIWFNAMALLNDTKVVYSNPHLSGFDYLENKSVQSIGLKNNNYIHAKKNATQLKEVFELYGLWDRKLM